MAQEIPRSISRIQLLPHHLVDQIKAGEVIERPATLLKELLENAIDAKSSKIRIDVENNGLDLISVSDNGTGMTFEELPFAFTRHSTSKLDRFEDLYCLGSYGFRGEALASMASIGKISCQSYSQELKSGGKYKIHGGEVLSHRNYAGPHPGTTIVVRDLFYNTPVRLNFVKSKITEKNALKKIIWAFILSNPQIEFVVALDQTEKLFFPPEVDSPYARSISLLFKHHQQQAITLKEEFQNHSLTAIVGQSAAKGTQRFQFIFINNRYVIDRSIHQSVIAAMKEKWGHGGAGHYVLFLTVPANQLDVNVHPNKTTVKFSEGSLLNSFVYASIRKNILNVDDHNNQGPSDNRVSSNLPDSFSSEISKNQTYSDELNHQRILGQIGKKTILIKIDVSFYLINTHALISTFLKNFFISNVPLNESHVLPLLISESFSVEAHFEKRAQQMLSIGLEFEMINEKKALLKTIPSPFKYFSHLEGLIKVFIQYPWENFDRLQRALEDFFSNHFSSDSVTENLTELGSFIFDQELIKPDSLFAIKLDETNIGPLMSKTH